MHFKALLILSTIFFSISSSADVLFPVTSDGFSIEPILAKCDSGYADKRIQNLAWIKASREYITTNDSKSDLGCAKQILEDITLLNRTSVAFAEIELRKADYEREVISSSGKDILNSETGLWGRCHTLYFKKIGATFDKIKSANSKGKPIDKETLFLSQLNTPEALTTHLKSLVTSSVETTCSDNRFEMNEWISVLMRTILRGIPKSFSFHPELTSSLNDFLENYWQNPETGYWGTWYQKDGKIIKTDDLSITFHILSYYRSEIKNLVKIFDTTLKIKDGIYPYGWRELDNRLCAHHAYDVVRIMHLAWNKLDDNRKQSAREHLEVLLSWSLNEMYLKNTGVFNKDGRCAEVDENGVYQFKFWKEIGFLAKEDNFWRSEPLPESQEILSKLKENGFEPNDL